MKGFKDTTRTQCITGKNPGPKGAAKVSQVLSTFKHGEKPSPREKRR